MRIALVLLALALLTGTSRAQITTGAECDRCISARDCPGDTGACRLNCQRAYQNGVTVDVTSAVDRCMQDCNHRFETCNTAAQRACQITCGRPLLAPP